MAIVLGAFGCAGQAAPPIVTAATVTAMPTPAAIPTSLPVPAHPPRPVTGQVGPASWYGEPHHGHVTASGEVFDMYRLTAAHRTLRFGSHARVTNLSNGRSVDVRVNDRGPVVPGRIIDLSYAAARALGAVGAGVVRVRVVPLD